MTTFYDLIKELANRVGNVRTSVATGGSTTTLIDTTLMAADDQYKGGTLLIDQATPVTPRVSSYIASSGTFSFAAIATAVTVGTGYTAISQKYPLDVLKRSINQAILESELIMSQDETLIIVADQERYTLPTGVFDIRRIELGTEGDGEWPIHYYWRVEDGEIRFLANAPSDTSLTCRIHYAARHAQLSALADTLSDKVNRDSLMVAACKHALLWRNYYVGRDESNTTELLNFYLNEDKAKHGIRVSELLPRDPILARY